MADIKTVWFDSVDKQCPHAEHPRPGFKRDCWQSLNGIYDYSFRNEDEKGIGEPQGKILVPFAPECALSGVEKPLDPQKRMWYRRTFTVNDELKGKELLLHFDAVDWQCSVFVNGSHSGIHTGGYIPFYFNITNLVKDGENTLELQVYDPTDEGWQQRGKQSCKSHGFWYTGTSGIWQSVWLEGVNAAHIQSVRMVPDIDNTRLNISAALSQQGQDAVLSAHVTLKGESIAQKELDPAGDFIDIPDMRLWSPEQPELYDVTFTLTQNGEAADTVASYFGMRKFSIENDENGIPRLCLNNKPYFQRGLLDQGYWCDGGMTPPTDEAMIYDIAKMKELGFNMLRKHIKVEPARWYYHCDRLGMLVWQDMISGGQYIGNFYAGVLPNLNITVKDNKYDSFSRGNPKWRENFKTELFEMIDHLYNCTSICCWVPFNEGWGQFDAKEIGQSVKQADPSRFVDHASGWYDQGGGDFKSMHKYIVPVYLPKTKGRPFVLSEFGGYSNIVSGHTWNEKKSFGYLMYKSKESLTAGYQKLLEKQVIPLIKRGLCATVYTQVSDVEFEVNGILTYDRKQVKLDEETLKQLNAKMTY